MSWGHVRIQRSFSVCGCYGPSPAAATRSHSGLGGPAPCQAGPPPAMCRCLVFTDPPPPSAVLSLGVAVSDQTQVPVPQDPPPVSSPGPEEQQPPDQACSGTGTPASPISVVLLETLEIQRPLPWGYSFRAARRVLPALERKRVVCLNNNKNHPFIQQISSICWNK